VAATGDTLTLDGTINASNFRVSGPGTVALRHDLTVASGGGFSIADNATVATQADLTIDASSAALNIEGQLSVDSGTLTFNVPAGGGGPAG